MAFSVNKAVILGNLGRDPELRHTQSGKAVVSFSVATSERGKDGNDRTEWHNVTAWDKLAELVNRLCRKGTKVYVEGRLQTREYTDKAGNQRFSTEIVAREMVFLTKSETGDGGGYSNNQGGGYRGGQSNASYSNANRGGGPGSREDIPYKDDEDLPF